MYIWVSACVCVCVCKSAMGYTSLTNSVLTRIKLFIGEKALFCLCGSHACLLNGVLMFECPFFFLFALIRGFVAKNLIKNPNGHLHLSEVNSNF